jgi:ATP-binding cassette subfamily C protein LapB
MSICGRFGLIEPEKTLNAEGIKDETALQSAFAIVNQGIPLLRTDVIVASFFINLLLLAFPLVVLQVYDRILPNQALGTLLLLMLGVIVALVLDAVLKTARAYVAGWAGAHFEHQVGLKSLEYLLSANADKFEEDPAGKHLDRMAGVDMVRDFYSSQASLVIVDLPFIIVFIAVLAYISGTLALVPVFLLVIFGAVALKIGARLKIALAERSIWDDRRYSFVIEVLTGIHTVKSCAMEKLIERRYEKLMTQASDSGLRVAYLSGLAQNVGSSFAQITMVAVVGAGSLYVVNGAISMGALAACMLLSGRTVQPVLRALAVWARFQAIRIAEVGLDELQTYKDTQTRISPLNENLEEIKIRNLYYRYGPNSPYVLRGINLDVKPGEVVGIRGGNGSGKTSLLRLIMGSMAPTKGTVFYNNHNTRRTELRHFQDQIAYLPQKPVLLEGTVLENITMFRGEEYYDEALEIAERLGLDKVFQRYPDGFDTIIGASTHSSIPNGVGQRITIARALLGNPKFILFDEANSALDGPGDARIRGVMQYYKPKTGIIIITYRPSLLAIADRRYELKSGALLPFIPEKKPVEAVPTPPTPATPTPDKNGGEP